MAIVSEPLTKTETDAMGLYDNGYTYTIYGDIKPVMDGKNQTFTIGGFDGYKIDIKWNTIPQPIRARLANQLRNFGTAINQPIRDVDTIIARITNGQ